MFLDMRCIYSYYVEDAMILSKRLTSVSKFEEVLNAHNYDLRGLLLIELLLFLPMDMDTLQCI